MEGKAIKRKTGVFPLGRRGKGGSFSQEGAFISRGGGGGHPGYKGYELQSF